MGWHKFYIESYGCSMNAADAEMLTGFLESRGFKQVFSPEEASLIMLNTCAVKTPTEIRMLRRARELSTLSRESGARLAVVGCLPKINAASIMEIDSKIVLAGPSLGEVANALSIPFNGAACGFEEKPLNPFVSIIPIANGCVGKCTYCCVKAARGELESVPEKKILARFGKAVQCNREVWLTAQDTGCYGFDIGASLPALLGKILESKKKFRVRVGMMNPNHLASFFDSYLELFEDERLYRFFHVPIQSGSDRILSAMNRSYKAAEAKRLCLKIRRRFPLASISTDIIVGFPGETESDFGKTVGLLEDLQPDVLNLSRFGARPGTVAASLPGQLHGRVSKQRSRVLAAMQKGISLKRNRLFLGKEQEIFVSERGSRGNFVGRNGSYKPVVVGRDVRGKFVKVVVGRAFPTYLQAKALPKQ